MMSKVNNNWTYKVYNSKFTLYMWDWAISPIDLVDFNRLIN